MGMVHQGVLHFVRLSIFGEAQLEPLYAGGLHEAHTHGVLEFKQNSTINKATQYEQSQER